LHIVCPAASVKYRYKQDAPSLASVKAGRMAQHVRMHRDAELRRFAGSLEADLLLLALEPLQAAQFIAPDRMDRPQVSKV
jgi:hypothetical protein